MLLNNIENKMDNSLYAQLKHAPYPGVSNVEEVEQPTGERCLTPTREWSTSIAGKPEGAALGTFYMLMGLMGVPPQVILTIAAVKFADAEKKIDFEKWITTRSNWKKEDQEGAILVLKTVEVRVEEMQKNKLSGAGPRDGLPALQGATKNPDDDWNLN